MRVEQVDERDSTWESSQPRFRLYVFDGPGNAVTTLDLTQCSVEQALEVAGKLDGEKLWSLAVVTGEGASRGLTWISGNDDNAGPSRDADDIRLRGQMHDRYLSARVIRGLAATLPNGLRVIRMFPEWGAGPLWESFTDNYPAEPEVLGISAPLASDLAAWNDQWQDRAEDEPLPDAEGWRARGWELFERVQDELRGIAEVRPEFARGG